MEHDDPAQTAPWETLERLADSGSTAEVVEFLEALSPRELALTLSRLPEDLRDRVFSQLPGDEAASLLEELPGFQASGVLETLEPRAAAAILDNLPSDTQADFIADLDEEEAEAILQEMEPAEAEDARRLSAYPPDVAGGLMMTESLSYSDQLAVSDVVDDLRTHAEDYQNLEIQYCYVTDEKGAITGVLRLRDLLLSPPKRKIRSVMIHDPVSVQDDTPLEELRNVFDQHHFLGVPVTDAEKRLLGVVKKSAVDLAWSSRDQSDFLKVQGIVGGEEIRSMPVWLRSRRRLAWLSVNILLNLIGATVIALFQETLSAVIALAVFLPVISDMSGCSGNQAVAVSMRELSLGLVRPSEVRRVWLKEAAVGLLNGAPLGILVGTVAWLWQGNIYLGLVLGSALALNTLVAVTLGGVIPLLLRRLGMDPAVSSGPILTTVTDMCGFFFVLGFASITLPLLTG